jgi:DNA invertase Pin-like site-specific DNA recombinase
MNKAIIYARFSPRPNADECDSITRQVEEAETWCQKNDYKVMGIYSDEALSGGSDDRQGMWDALYSLKRGYTLVVRSFDRLYRDSAMGLYVIKTEIEKKGAKIVSITDPGASADSPDARLVRGILLSLAEYQRELIRAKTRAAMRRYQKEGRVMSKRIPFGYLRDTKDMTRMVSFESEQATIRNIFNMKTAGKSLRAIARHLNEKGIKTKEGSEWKHIQIARILEREKANFHFHDANMTQDS